jgi:hypothetical protein
MSIDDNSEWASAQSEPDEYGRSDLIWAGEKKKKKEFGG